MTQDDQHIVGEGHHVTKVGEVHSEKHSDWRAYRTPLRLALYAEATGGSMPGAQAPHCGVIAVPSAFLASTSLHRRRNHK